MFTYSRSVYRRKEMKSKEPHVMSESEYYIHQCSAVATKVYLYPIHIGHFYYEPGYYLRRTGFDNYLIMYIEKGSCSLRYRDSTHIVREGQVVLLDCRLPHEYGNTSQEILEISWLHFEGITARNFYELITERNGNVFSLSNAFPVTHNLHKLLDLFSTSAPIKEGDISRYITRMLSDLLYIQQDASKDLTRSEIIENSLSYINEHFAENLTLKNMAENVSLSPYYFSRVFAAETGFTPYQYLIATRLNSARFLLQSGELSVKEIAFQSGFTSESNFCYTFRKQEGMTPGTYRDKMKGSDMGSGPQNKV